MNSVLIDPVEPESRTENLDAELTAQMLAAPQSLMQLSLDEARLVTQYMTLRQISAQSMFIEEGDTLDNDFLVLILEGEVEVEKIEVSQFTQVSFGVMGPYSIHGEISLVDGRPRSATCIARTDLRCAVLNRIALQALIHDHPPIGAKFSLGLARRAADRLRDNSDLLKKYMHLVKSMRGQMDDAGLF